VDRTRNGIPGRLEPPIWMKLKRWLLTAISSTHPSRAFQSNSAVLKPVNNEKRLDPIETKWQSSTQCVDEIPGEFRELAARLCKNRGMDWHKMLAELKSERAQIDQAILALTRLVPGTKRRGRPPSWLSKSNAIAPKRGRGRPPGSKNKLKYPNAKRA
jgi:hypothetical protein